MLIPPQAGEVSLVPNPDLPCGCQNDTGVLAGTLVGSNLACSIDRMVKTDDTVKRRHPLLQPAGGNGGVDRGQLPDLPVSPVYGPRI